MYHMGFRLLLCVYDLFNSALSDEESVTQNQPLLPLGLCPWEHSPEWHYFIRGQEKFYSSLAWCQVGFPKLLGFWLLPICGYSLHTPRLRWGLAWRCYAILLRGGCEDEQASGLIQLPWLLGFPGCNMVALILLVGWGHRYSGWLSRGQRWECRDGAPYCFIGLQAWQGPLTVWFSGGEGEICIHASIHHPSFMEYLLKCFPHRILVRIEVTHAYLLEYCYCKHSTSGIVVE